MATAQVLPKELRLQAPPTMPQARSYLFKQQSTQSTYTEGETIQINIPRLQRSYLTKDSYIKFKLKVPFTSATEVEDAETHTFWLWDFPLFDTPGALGLIKKIEIYDYLGSTLLESTSGHDALSALLLDLGVGNEVFGHHYNKTVSTHQGAIIKDDDIGHGNSVTYEIRPPAYGESLYNDDTIVDADDPTTYTQTVYREFAFPLFSFLGVLSTKYAPLHNGYTINITLNKINHAMSFCRQHPTPAAKDADSVFTTTDVIFSEVNMCCQVLELGPVAESMLLSSTQGQPLVIPSKAYRNFIGSISAGSGTYRLDLNLNVASLTNILFMMRRTANLTDPLRKKTLSSRIRNYLVNWYFQYGSSILPQTSGISCRGKLGDLEDFNLVASQEAYIELLKARHKFNTDDHTNVINNEGFNIDLDDDNYQYLWSHDTLNRATFAAGLDLELVSGRSNDLVCGMNTNGMNTSIYLTFDTSAGTPVAATLDAWCEYDAFINVSPGLATTVSF